MGVKVLVIYVDGRRMSVPASPRAQVMTEREYKGDEETKSIESGYYLAWASLKAAGKETLDFEAWLDVIEEVEPSRVQADPTEPVPPSDSSSS